VHTIIIIIIIIIIIYNQYKRCLISSEL